MLLGNCQLTSYLTLIVYHTRPRLSTTLFFFFYKKKRVSRTPEKESCLIMKGSVGVPPDLLLVYHRRSPLSTPMAKKSKKKA